MRAEYLLFLLLFSLLFLDTGTRKPEYVPEQQLSFDNIWMFAPIPDGYLADDAAHWSNDVGLTGFIQSGVVEWYSSESTIEDRFDAIQRMNRNSHAAGLRGSILKIALGYSELPAWQDETGLQEVLNTFRQIFQFAEQSGYSGITFDIEVYNKPLWTPDVDLKGMQNFARDLGKLKQQHFPDGKLMVVPENMLFDEDRYHFAGEFVAALFQAAGDSVCYIGSESTYRSFVPVKLAKRLKSLEAKLAKWQAESSLTVDVELVPGFWPLGFYRVVKDPLTGKRHYYDADDLPVPDSWGDKSANYSPQDFRNQLLTAARLNYRSIWIYSHGAAWWQLPDSSYSHVRNLNNQLLPVVDNIEEYEKVLREFRHR